MLYLNHKRRKLVTQKHSLGGNHMEIDRYCNDCLGYYSYDIDETENFNKCRWCGSEDTEEV